jgi:hypothetical protein
MAVCIQKAYKRALLNRGGRRYDFFAAMRLRCSRGETRLYFLKTFEKYRGSVKPTDSAPLKIIANVLNLKIINPATEQGPGYGAAILAMVGCGEYASVKSTAVSIVKDVETTHPDGAVSAACESHYRRYTALYPALNKFRRF